MPFVCTGVDAFSLLKYMRKPCFCNSSKSLVHITFSIRTRYSQNKSTGHYCYTQLFEKWKWFWKVYFSYDLAHQYDFETNEIFDEFWRSNEITGSWLNWFLLIMQAIDWANEIKEKITEYFSKKGCVPWQWKSAQVNL